MLWDGTTSIHNNWGTAPTTVAPILLICRLTMQADSIRVYPLDSLGRETKGYTTCLPVQPNTFNVILSQSQTTSMWFGVEAYGNGAVSEVKDVAWKVKGWGLPHMKVVGAENWKEAQKYFKQIHDHMEMLLKASPYEKK